MYVVGVVVLPCLCMCATYHTRLKKSIGNPQILLYFNGNRLVGGSGDIKLTKDGKVLLCEMVHSSVSLEIVHDDSKKKQ